MRRSRVRALVHVRMGPFRGRITRAERSPRGRLLRFWVRWDYGLGEASEYAAWEARNFERAGPAHRG